MKVYAVVKVYDDYSCDFPEDIFSSKEKAEKFVEDAKNEYLEKWAKSYRHLYKDSEKMLGEFDFQYNLVKSTYEHQFSMVIEEYELK